MRVKTLCSVMLGVTGLVASMTAQAQDAPATAPEGAPPAAPAETTPPPAAAGGTVMGTRMLLGADFALAIPLGDLGDAAGIGFGGLARFEYVLTPPLNLTVRAGYIHHLEKNGFTYSTIPVLAGVKFAVADAVYLAAELGFFNNRGSFGSLSSSETDFGATVGAGYRMGDLDLRAGLQFADLGNAGESMSLVINAGYNFLRM